jgi:ATP/maltotriose-dependent transcriptional regulator MalT
MAIVTCSCLAGGAPKSQALQELERLRESDVQAPSYFNELVRSLLCGALGFRADEQFARDQLERAAKIAAETGNTLLEARALVAWGGMLVEIPRRVDQGLLVLERATTLLAHGDAPSLEHIAEHNRGAALVIQGRYAEASPHFHRAREAAHGERSLEHEMLSSMNEAFSLLCLGDSKNASRLVAELADARLALVSPRTAAYAHVARSLYAIAFQDFDQARTELAHARSRAVIAEADGTDVYLVVEVLALVYDAAQGSVADMLPRASELERLAQDSGFVSYYWFDVLRAALGHVKDPLLRTAVGDALRRATMLLGSASQALADART